MLRVTNHQRPPYQLGFIGPTHRRRADRILRVSGVWYAALISSVGTKATAGLYWRADARP